MPKRIQLSRKKGWRKPEGAVVVARPTKWGNPFGHVRPEGYRHKLLCYIPDQQPIYALGCMEVVSSDPATQRRNSVVAFEAWVKGSHYAAVEMRAAANELRGKDLCCWCPLDQPCHADVLLEIANEGDR